MLRAITGTLVAVLMWFAPAATAQIVYSHGGSLWVMSDSGTGARELASTSEIGGNVSTDQGVSVQPGGTGIAFLASVPASDGICSGNCPGVWSLVGGKLTALTPAAYDCAHGDPDIVCQTSYSSPTVTSSGDVIYGYDTIGLVYSCPICGDGGGGEMWQVEYRPLNGSGAEASWPVPAATTEAENEGWDPGGIAQDMASDPVDPSTLLYTGGAGESSLCSTTPLPLNVSCFPLDVEQTAPPPPTVVEPSVDIGGYDGVAYSQNGSLIADIETTTTPGIWIYPASQSDSSNAAQYYWALKDPGPSGDDFSNLVIRSLTFVGNDELVFSADNNLWSMTSSCWGTNVNTNAPSPKCGTFGSAPTHVTQLTTDGTAADPYIDPSWTSSAAVIPAAGTPTCACGNVPPPDTTDEISKLKLSSGTVKLGKRLTIDVTLRSASKITAELLRQAHSRYSRVETLSFRGKPGLNKLSVTIKHGFKTGKYEVSVVAGAGAHTIRFSVKR